MSRALPLTAADLLRLAAMPTFAGMALLTSAPGGGMETMCASGHPSVLAGMAPMYLLMSAFHSPPWLKLVSGLLRRRSAGLEPVG